jgi:hypothetical protein
MLQTETSDGLSHETLKVTKNVISEASASSKSQKNFKKFRNRYGLIS